MTLRVGQMLFMSTSLMMLTVGCQQQADEGAEQKPLSKADEGAEQKPLSKSDEGAEQKPLSKTEAAKYRQVTVKVTGLT